MADTIKQKILFQMGTTGTSKATKSFGQMATKVVAVGAAIAVAVKGMNKLYDSAVELDRQLKALNTDMGLYNEQTKGLIGTNDGLSAAIQLQNANIKVSKEEMAALGKASIKMNQQLGGGPEGATTTFNNLVKSIVNARESGLVKFGVELSQTSNKTEASQEALQKLTEKFGDVNVEAETAKEKMFAFNNSLGTVAASEFNGFLTNMNHLLQDSIEFWAGGSDAMLQYENDIMATKGAISEYMWTMDGMALRGATWIASIMGNKNAVAQLNDEYRDQVNLMMEVNALQNRVNSSKETIELWDRFRESKSPRDMAMTGKRLQASLSGMLESEMDERQLRIFKSGFMQEDFNALTASSTKTPRSKSKGMGGAGSRKTGDSMDFTLGEIGGSAFTDISGDTDGFDRIFGGGDLSSMPTDIFGAGAGASAGRAQAAAQEQAKFERGMAETKLQVQSSTLQTMLGMERQYLAESNRLNAQSNAQKAQSAEAMGSAVGSTFSNLSKSMNTESKEGFNAMKAMSYAGNIVETTLAATAAFRSVMQTVPFPANVVMAPILAGSVAAMGAANGRKIRQQKYGTSGSASTSTSKVAFPTGGVGAGSGTSSDNYIINVNVDGNRVHQSMMNSNDLAKQSNEKHFMTGDN